MYDGVFVTILFTHNRCCFDIPQSYNGPRALTLIQSKLKAYLHFAGTTLAPFPTQPHEYTAPANLKHLDPATFGTTGARGGGT